MTFVLYLCCHEFCESGQLISYVYLDYCRRLTTVRDRVRKTRLSFLCSLFRNNYFPLSVIMRVADYYRNIDRESTTKRIISLSHDCIFVCVIFVTETGILTNILYFIFILCVLYFILGLDKYIDSIGLIFIWKKLFQCHYACEFIGINRCRSGYNNKTHN